MSNKLLKRIIKRLKQNIKVFYLSKIRVFVRLSSYPYISGDTFRKLANHIYDERKVIKVSKIKKGDILFIKTDNLDQFIDNILIKIDKKVVLIFHNSDLSFTKNKVKHFEEKDVTIFSQNLDIEFEFSNKFFPLPIGIENRSYLMNGRIKNFDRIINNSIIKKDDNLILCAINPNTNPTRVELLKIASKNKLINFLRYTEHKNYLELLATYKFNLCPEGNGIDTHRFWESLMMKSIPIVLKSNTIEQFTKFDIPCLVLNDWSELKNYTRADYENFYSDNFKLLKNNEYIYFDFWKNLILDKTHEI